MLAKLKDVSTVAAQKALAVAKEKAQQARSNMPVKGAKSDQHIVALDIGTEYVKALIGKVQPDGGIEIVGMGRQHQALTDMQAGAIADIAGVVENCDKALNKAEQEAGVSVRQAIIGIAGELVKGTTTTVRVSRKDSAKQLDIQEMEKIIRLVQDRAEVRAARAYLGAGRQRSAGAVC